MAHKFNKGESIFFLFKKGKTVQDSQRKPRFYLTRDKAEMYLPFGDEIVEYAPVRHGRWVVHHHAGNNWCECSECNTVGSPQWKRCPVCEAKMDVTDINVGNKTEG